MTLRLRGSKTELEEMGEDVSDMATTTSALQAKLLALTGGQVDIMLDENTFKNSTQILREMADAWEDMNDIQRASALELMGGKRQANVLSALIKNFDTVEKVIETSANSSGSALEENERYLDSIQGKIDQFNNAMQAMWSNTLDSDMVKGFVAFGTEIIKLIDKIGLLNVAIAGLFIFLEKKHGMFGGMIESAAKKVATTNIDRLKAQQAALLKQQVEAQQKTSASDVSEEAKKDLVEINSQLEKTNKELAEAEAKLAAIDKNFKPSSVTDVVKDAADEFDPKKAKNSITGKKSARTRRANQLQADGKSFAEIEADPKIQQYTKEINEGQRALDAYNEKVKQTDASMKQANSTTQAGVAANIAADATTKKKTASTWADVVAEIARTGSTGASVIATMKQVVANKLAGNAFVKKGIDAMVASGAITAEAAASAAALPITTLLTAGVTGLAASFSALWAVLWPVLLIIGAIALAIGAVVGVVKLFDSMIKTSAELREELSGLKEELSDVKSEIESLNGELATTQERMAELLAKDSLTFTEQEELEALQKQNDELEREIWLLEQRKKRLQDDAEDVFDDLMEKETKEKDRDGDGEEEIYDKSLEKNIEKYEKAMASEEEARVALEEAYRSGDEKDIEKAEKKLEKAEKKSNKFKDKVDEELNQYLEDSEGIDYDSADAKTKAYLDYINNTVGRVGIIEGDEQGKSNEIKRIFNKSDYEDASKTIENLVENLKKDPTNENIISQIRTEAQLAEKDLKAVGLTVQDATDYFTMLGQNAAFDTMEGKMAEVTMATSKFQTLLSNTKSADFTNLFDTKTGEVSATAIAEYFQGTSEATREEIAKIVKAVNEGEISVDTALKQFELFTVQSVVDIQIKEVSTNFKDVFTDLEDADGLIDTFEELGDAIGSTVGALDALNKAQGEMAYSGRVSIQTALELMQYTDNYADVLEVVDGKLQLNKNAEENLINARINAMKVSAQTALADAQAAYEKAKLATQTYNDALTTDMSASVVAKAWEKVLAAGAGLVEGIKSLFTEESWTEAYNRAYNETLSNMTGYETTYNDAGLQALKDAEAEAEQSVKNAQGNVDLLGEINAGNIKEMYESDDIEDPEDAAKTKLEEKMEEFQRAMDYWENRIAANQARYEQLQNEIDLLEAKGQKADASYYEEQIKLENERLWLLEQQKAEAQKYIQEIESTAGIGSEEWWEIANVLNSIEGELDSVTQSIVDLQDAIAEIDTYKFEEFNTRLDNLVSKLGTIRDLIAPDESDWFDDQGEWTDEGVAVLGSYVQELELYKQGLEETEAELKKYNKAYSNNTKAYYEGLGIHSEQEYYEKTQELTEQQYDFAKSISDTEQSIVDMYESNIDAVEEYIETLIEGYNDYIDSVKEALDAERDLYKFKKNVQKQSKDIAELERRIASLSGTTNKSELAERRKLEAQLYEAREGLNDTYYDHSKDALNNALDEEQSAYEETMNKFVEGMRTSLETATMDMDAFLGNVTTMVSLNAGAILEQYQQTELPLDDALTNPWEAAKQAVGDYSGDALELMNTWAQNGFLTTFPETVTGSLKSPWEAGQTAAGAFKTSVDTVMSNVVKTIETNVKTASSKLSELYKQIEDTERRAASVGSGTGGSGSGGDYTGGDGGGGTGETALQKAIREAQAYVDAKGFSEGDKARWGQDLNFRPLLQAVYAAGGTIDNLKGKVYAPKGNTTPPKTTGKIPGTYSVSGINLISLGADDITVTLGGKSYKAALSLPNNGNVIDYQINKDFGGTTPANGKLAMLNGVLYVSKNNHWYKVGSKNDGNALTNAAKNKLNGYAKGTTGTTRDEWAITDEPQFGDELVLVPGKDGNLSFMRKGTGVVPASLTEELMKLGEIGVDGLMNTKQFGANISMISNAVNKPEFTLNVDNFLRCDNVSQDSLPELKQFVKTEMNNLVKQMNYSLKGKGAR